MNKIIKLVCTVSLFFVGHAAIACDYPDRIKVPNGNTATKEEMLDGQRSVKKFVTDMEVYLECIVAEEEAKQTAMEEALPPEEEQQRQDMLNKKYNAGVDEMERIAAKFNTEVQAYKAKDSS